MNIYLHSLSATTRHVSLIPNVVTIHHFGILWSNHIVPFYGHIYDFIFTTCDKHIQNYKDKKQPNYTINWFIFAPATVSSAYIRTHLAFI